MKWPWIVSGNRHRRLLRKYREEKKLRRELIARMDPAELVASALPDPASPEAGNLLDIETGQLNARQLKAIFRRDTNQPVRKAG